MQRKRTSVVWKLCRDEFQELVNTCNTRVEVLQKLGLNGYSGNHTTLNKRIKEDNINIEHILEYRKTIIYKAIFASTIPLDKILVEHSTYRKGGDIKKRLIKSGLLIDKCNECGQLPMWNSKPLVLHLDHINGVHDDNRVENLRVLCPHCHSQTETFSGRNASTRKNIKCVDCGIKIGTRSSRCDTCERKNRFDKKTKIAWPSNEDLIDMLNHSNFTQVADKLGVSDSAIKKRLKRRHLLVRVVGYDPTASNLEDSRSTE